ncbi:DEAD/DEAH box helicase family protein [Luteolibacter pohnpeiensis]|uniref:DEAD/DEAH box helicase family protein n=1 Tax=Luteolibacter pohnpeiensis TaxID=454153 RepID=A0A934SCJ8_9BACT|nr:DEAD/DEAH box helicase [Luteolibacter pohnpeiensis]MBK1883647.1 DEAD/DEAH box helicase family protein [Luteolibacter pohnpeiensis]
MILRPYQDECVQGIAKGFQANFRRQLAVLPTGGGKTIVFAAVANRFLTKRNERTLVLAHREELIEQAADKIFKSTGIEAEVEKAERRASQHASVVVASIQTMQGQRLEGWPRDHFGLLVADEAHHSLANQWQTTLNYFDSRILGVTATPDRGDKRKLSEFYDNVAYECTILDLIRAGFLSPVMVRAVPLKIDLSKVKQIGDDLDAGQLGDAIEPYVDTIAEYLAKECSDRKIAVFLPLVETSKKFVAACERAGISARHIDGSSPDRKEILSDYTEGKFQLISNAMLLTEGWDEPSVDCVVILRPTKSRSLFAQMVGRGTRLSPGKENLLLLDFLWLHEKHNLAKPASLVASSEAEEESITEAILLHEERDLTEATDAAEMEREAALIRELTENAAKKARYMPIESVAALLKDTKMREYEPTFGWEKSPATAAQKKCLERFHIKCPVSKGEASMLMGRLFDRSKSKLASVGQLLWLHRLGHPSPATATQKEAKAFLDAKWGKKTKV